MEVDFYFLLVYLLKHEVALSVELFSSSNYNFSFASLVVG